MENRNLGLSARLAHFARLVAETVCTDSNDTPLPLEAGLQDTVRLLAATHGSDGTIYLLGNGGSAAIVSHVQTDLVNAAGLRAFTLHESSLLTCMANDRSYPAAFSEILKRLRPKATDFLLIVSSSGRSQNLVNAADTFLNHGGRVITLTGFANDNPLRRLGQINLWIDSDDYGLVECAHQFLLHNLTDRLADFTKST